jgi:hypothetical protein
MVTSGPPTSYQPDPEDNLGPQTLTPWEGTHVALLTEPPPGGGAYDPAVITRILNALDGAYEVYAQFTGATPSPFVTYDGKLSIAVLPDNSQYNFAAHGYLGLTGIEIQQAYFDAMYNDAQNNQYDQALFYELGRNFWFFKPELGDDPFATGFAIAGRFISMDVAGLAGGPFNGAPFNTFKGETLDALNAAFFSNPAYTLADTLEANVVPANTSNSSVADFAGSLLYRVYDDFGLNGYTAFYHALKNQPVANTPADAVANFIHAASQATGVDYGFLDKPAGVAYLVGTAGDDRLVATTGGPILAYDGDDTVQGSPGADSIFGGGGGDLLHGGGGADLVIGGAGADSLDDAGAGPDTLFGGDGADSISGGPGFNQVNGNKGDDTIVGHSRSGDWLSGGQGDDIIDASGSTGHNILNGNLGNDTITGDDSGDTLRGGQGDDTIHGGAGADAIHGDLGNNTLAGGGGADSFYAGAGAARDVITDFHQSEGDRVLVGAGLTYTTAQVNGDVEVDVSNGDVIVLQNTQLQALSAGWIVSA